MTSLFNSNLLLSAALSVITLISSNDLMASTPDGDPPANEGICDTLHGGTPGLYGLCIAYCEAQDLDTYNKNPPNTKILENYRRKMQAGDPDMPCIQAPCPCWSDADMTSITADGIAVCSDRGAPDEVLEIIDNTPESKTAVSEIVPGRERCIFTDLNVTPVTVRHFWITPEESAICHASVTSACAAVQ